MHHFMKFRQSSRFLTSQTLYVLFRHATNLRYDEHLFYFSTFLLVQTLLGVVLELLIWCILG